MQAASPGCWGGGGKCGFGGKESGVEEISTTTIVVFGRGVLAVVFGRGVAVVFGRGVAVLSKHAEDA